ncbi:MAG TPA: hypothetical protein VG674_03880 [Amycolatopsis sp.]|nr:hypothetical protein [Amycolatopsis sp.]
MGKTGPVIMAWPDMPDIGQPTQRGGRRIRARKSRESGRTDRSGARARRRRGVGSRQRPVRKDAGAQGVGHADFLQHAPQVNADEVARRAELHDEAQQQRRAARQDLPDLPRRSVGLDVLHPAAHVRVERQVDGAEQNLARPERREIRLGELEIAVARLADRPNRETELVGLQHGVLSAVLVKFSARKRSIAATVRRALHSRAR